MYLYTHTSTRSFYMVLFQRAWLQEMLLLLPGHQERALHLSGRTRRDAEAGSLCHGLRAVRKGLCEAQTSLSLLSFLTSSSHARGHAREHRDMLDM